MDPDTFLAQEDVQLLVQALNTFAFEVDDADIRKDILINAGIHFSFLSKLKFGASPDFFANKLVGEFRRYRVSEQQPTYHPMVNLLDYLLKTRELESQDRMLFKRLVAQGRENFGGLMALRAVGRIESPQGTAIGTGVLVDKNLLLTCAHVFSSDLSYAWVRFGYKIGKYGIEMGEVFALDLSFVSRRAQPDFALVKINSITAYHPATVFNGPLNDGQKIRLIHHPLGEPAQISCTGHIVQMGEDYIDHDINTDNGSSGAPIFDLSWRVIAIHQGDPGIGRHCTPGTTGGIRLHGIWKDIMPYLSSSVEGSTL